MHGNARLRFLAIAGLASLAISCATSPTGRNQLLLMSEAEMAQMGTAAFVDIQRQTPQSKNTAEVGYVRCVAGAITDVLEPEELAAVSVQQWQVEVFEDPTANAFALPGGKIGVHTGLLEVATNPAQLAAVLGHEVGHVTARHGNERVSQTAIAQQGMSIVGVMVGSDSPEKQTALGLLGVGMQYGVLMPYGRAQESESDMIGLDLMARAGFDPRESVTLWENMAKASGGAAPPEFMSTHPSHRTRIEQLRAKLPEVLPAYESAIAAGRKPGCRP